MLTLQNAVDCLMDRVQPLAPRKMGLCEALGCRLAEVPVADSDSPMGDVSTMDGYAACADDLDESEFLPVAFEIPAGHVPQPLSRGSVVRIFTGALLPDGADTVIKQEDVIDRDGDRVKLPRRERGTYVRHKGEVCRAGVALAESGSVITPQLLGLLASIGPTNVTVIPRPRVAVMTTGDELVSLDEPIQLGRIRDSNGPMITALAREAGFPTVGQARVADEPETIRATLTTLTTRADLLLTCGGVSVGDYDFVPGALTDLGAEVLFHRLSVKPGKPILTARLGDCWVIGLPGNPASALVGWQMIARRIGERLGGDPDAFEQRTVGAVLDEPTRNTGDRTVIAPARIDHSSSPPHVTVLQWKGSHDTFALGQANALAMLEIGSDWQPGDTIECFLID